MADLVREEKLYIGGKWVPGAGAPIEVECPISEEVIGVAASASSADVDDAVSAASSAFASWSATSVADRVAMLRSIHAVISEQADHFADLVNLEQGSPAPVARKLHVDVPLRVIEETATALEEFSFTTEIANSLIVREPVGVVGAITPWNLPLHQIIVKVIPAIAAGATVVSKPSELSPLTAFALARAFEKAGLPAGVFNLVPGTGPEVGELLSTHEGIDLVSFTGSTAVGRKVAAAAAATIKKVTLELGGKSASVVLGDVDDELLEKAVKITVATCFLNAGQTCTALSRLIVPHSKLEKAEEIAAAAAAKQVPGERMGPVISRRARERVHSYLDEKATLGAVEVTQSKSVTLPEKGYYVAPVVFTQVKPESALAREEVFGPVLSILSAKDDDAALVLANDSIYGLGGAVWGADQTHALEVAGRIRTGQVDVNGGAFNPRAPFGGYKQSGIGREIGDFGIADVLQVKAIQR